MTPDKKENLPSSSSEEEEEMMDLTQYFTQASSTLTYSNPLLCSLPSPSAQEEKEDWGGFITDEGQHQHQSNNNKPVFNLQDSMAALEIMDPIMDCCEIPIEDDDVVVNDNDDNTNSTTEKNNATTTNTTTNTTHTKNKLSKKTRQKTKPPRNTPTSLHSHNEEESLPWDDVTLPEAKVIALETLSRLESNLRGASVAESTYTCLYAHDGVLLDMGTRLGFFGKEQKNTFKKEEPKRFETETTTTTTAAAASTTTLVAQTAIFTTSLSLVKLTETIRAIVMHADIYEEEDYCINSSSFTFCNVVREDMLRRVLKNALEMIGGVDKEEERESVEVLEVVIGFYQSLFEVCASLAKLTAKTVQTATKHAKNIIQKCVAQLDKLSNILSTKKDENDKNTTLLLRKAFDSNVNRRLLGNAPVRKVKFLTHAQSITSLRSTLHQCDWSVCDLLLLNNHTLQRIQRQLSHISTSNINILGRSLIVLNLYFDDLLLGQYALSEIIAKHMQQMGGVPELLLKADYGKSFLHRLGKPLYDTLKVLTLNRNRQRAYMDALMMREWAALQREATAVDYYYKEDEYKLNAAAVAAASSSSTTTPYVTNYVLGIGVWLMEHHLGLGVELDLFCGEHDLSIAYWYWDFLLSTRLNVVTSMRKEVMEGKVREVQRQQQIMDANQEAAKAKAAAEKVAVEHRKNSKGKKKGRKKSAAAAATTGGQGNNSPSPASLAATTAAMSSTDEDVENDMEFMFLGLRRLLCRGIVRFIAALNQAGLVRSPVFEFTSHERRFEKRFESFSVVPQPPPLTYDDYCQGSDFSSIKAEELLASAADCFRASKAAVDKLLVMLNKISSSSDRETLAYLPVAKEEVMALAKVCVGNSLFLHKLTQQVKSGEKVAGKVSIDFSAHKQFCSIKIT